MRAPHQQRVVDERADLHEKIARLEAFMFGDPMFSSVFEGLHIGERDRLRRQYACMCDYRTVLDERIAAF